jgi:FixJ family two-component response regulator
MIQLAGGSRETPAKRSRKVIVIEDDDSMREALTRLLGAAGLESSAFSSAEEFLAAGVGEEAACVVSDLRLPETSGLELLDVLRARGNRIPFILITAHDQPGQREDAARRGAAAYLIKPFRGTVFLDTVRTVIAPLHHQ